MAHPLLLEITPPLLASSGKPSRSASYKTRKYHDESEFPSSSLHDLFQASVETYADLPALGFRPTYEQGKPGNYNFLSYREAGAKVHAVASALHHAGVQKGQRVAIYGQNSCEWMIILQACSRMGYVVVPLYDTLGENAVEYIVNHSEATYAAVSAAKLPQLAAALPQLTRPLSGLTVWGGDPDPGAAKTIAAAGVEMSTFEELLARGEASAVPADPPDPEDVSTIMYTSGTTGDPKGVMLSHGSIVATVRSVWGYLKAHNIPTGPGERMLSYLPLAHIFDRVMEEAFLGMGGSVGYWRGRLPDLVADIGALRPTQFHGVPRVFERIYTRVRSRVETAGFVKRGLFGWAYQGKLARLQAGFPSATAAPLWDRLVFKKLKQTLGGQLKLVVSGGAPLAPHVEQFLRVILGAPVVQGYGLTETCGASFIAVPDNICHAGTIGLPVPVTEFALESVPEMKYDALGTPARGELLMRGSAVFQGYHKQPAQTDEVLEAGGWFHTGDIAEIQPDGAVKIIDRKKNIFKLSQGEYVAVEKVEAEYKKCSAIDQIWVCGNSFKSCLVAVVVPNRARLLEWAGTEGKPAAGADFAALCGDEDACAWLLAALQAQGRDSKLRGFEVLKAVHLHPEEFSVEAGMVTPTFKLRRPQLLEAFQQQVDAMYKQVDLEA
eukprot:jgi/Ulvmu1/7130/UM034_0036.1